MLWNGIATLTAIGALAGAARIALVAAPLAELRELRLLVASPHGRSRALPAFTGDLGRFVQRVRESSDDAARIDLIAERLAAVDLETWCVRERVGMWARAVLFSGAACAVAALCESLGRGLRSNPALAAVPFVIGAGAATGCLLVGRWADCRATERRCAWDTLSAALIRPLMPEQILELQPQPPDQSSKRQCPFGS